jgi:hypothetical protein
MAAELHAGGMNGAQSVLSALGDCGRAGLGYGGSYRDGFGGGFETRRGVRRGIRSDNGAGLLFGKPDVTDREKPGLAYGKVTLFIKQVRELHGNDHLPGFDRLLI